MRSLSMYHYQADPRDRLYHAIRLVAIALNLIRKNLALEIISEATGLTIAQLQELQSSDNIDRA
jgi:hypothetical protein